MKDEIFNDLVASVREGGAILREEKQPARVFVFGRLVVQGMQKHLERVIPRRNKRH